MTNDKELNAAEAAKFDEFMRILEPYMAHDESVTVTIEEVIPLLTPAESKRLRVLTDELTVAGVFEVDPRAIQ